MTSFSDLGLAAPLLTALEAEGYTRPTPIQTKAIPAVLGGTDLLGIAQTGTGKTAAFALPILHRLAANRRQAPRGGCRVLVLSPTRELASQIADSFRAYGRHLPLSVAVIFGGVAHRPQIQALTRGVDILVATPGRLLDHIGERYASLQGTEILVLDEADQMLDLSFIKPIRRIVGQLTARRQTLLFSATMPEEIASLAREFLRDPVRIAVTPVASTVESVSQRVIHVATQGKRGLLAELLRDPAMSRTLVFTRTKRGADRVAQHLDAAGIPTAAIHGNKSQRQREISLEAFRNAEVRALVATDIAARGIDVDAVSHVVNFEMPEVPEIYVHRIGRTARAGASGSAISLCDSTERDLLRRIERLIRQTLPAEERHGDFGGAAPQRQHRPASRAERHDDGRAPPRHRNRREGGERAGQAGAGRRKAENGDSGRRRSPAAQGTSGARLSARPGPGANPRPGLRTGSPHQR